MNQTEEILIRLGLDAKGFTSGLDSVGSKIKSWGAGLVAGITAGAVIGEITNIINKFDELQDKASNLDIGTDFLQGMEQIAKLDSTGGPGAFYKSIQTLSQNIGLAKEGSEEAVKKFNKLGLSLEEIKDLNAEQIFYKISDKIHAVSDASIRAELAMSLLGKSGKDLIGIISSGSEELKKSIDQTTKLDAPSVKVLGQAKDDLEKLSNKWDVFTAKLIVGFMALPKIPSMLSAKNIDDARKAGLKLSEDWVRKREEKSDKEVDGYDPLEKVKKMAEESARAADYAERAAAGRAAQEKETADQIERQVNLSRQLKSLYDRAKNIKHNGNNIDRAQVSISDLAGRAFTNRLNSAYGPGGAYDLAKGEGPFGDAARGYLLSEKQQQWDITHGNAVFNEDGELIGGAAYDDMMRQRKYHNMLKGAGLDTPEMQFKEMRESLGSIQKDIAALFQKADREGINIKVSE